MRLIDADELLKDPYFDDDSIPERAIFIQAVNECPTITPDSLVKRGRWEEIRNAYGEFEGWLCECGREVKSKDKFCPSCGALMED